MRQFLGHGAVVGQQQNSGGGTIKATDGVDALAAGLAHQIHYRFARSFVVHCGNKALGLIE